MGRTSGSSGDWYGGREVGGQAGADYGLPLRGGGDSGGGR